NEARGAVEKSEEGGYLLGENGSIVFALHNAFALSFEANAEKNPTCFTVAIGSLLLTVEGLNWSCKNEDACFKGEFAGKTAFTLVREEEGVWLDDGLNRTCLGAYAAADACAIVQALRPLTLRVTEQQRAPIFACDFSAGVAPMFTWPKVGAFSCVNPSERIEDGVLRLCDESVALVAPFGTKDFSLTAEVGVQADSFGLLGITDGCNGLTVKAGCGRCLVFAHHAEEENSSRNVTPFADTLCNTEGKLSLRFEKTGTRYSVFVKPEMGAWMCVAEGLPCNLSQIYGILTAEGGTVCVDSVRFGDGKAYATYLPKGEIDLSTDDYVAMRGQAAIHVTGSFKDCFGGYRCISYEKSTFTSAGHYKDFKAELTLKDVDAEENASLSVVFVGGSIGFEKDGIVLYRNGEKIAEAAYLSGANPYRGEPLRIVIARMGKTVRIWQGQNSLFACEGVVPYHVPGGVGLHSVGCKYSLTDFNFFHGGSNWCFARGHVRPMQEGLDRSAEGFQYAYAYTTAAVNDFAFSANIKFNRSASVADGAFSVVYGLTPGAHPETNGVRIAIRKEGEVIVSVKGKELTRVPITGFYSESFFLYIERRGAHLTVKIAPSEYEPRCIDVLQVETAYSDGGAVCFYEDHTRSFICNAKLVSLAEGEDAGRLQMPVIAPSKHRYMI
ncbi:MAG: hypothetical protein IJF71_01815, partial [Clostridia bacterium]|nr:hypothetical protein [Clostridia bacterium]